MSVFNSLGSNYSGKFVLNRLFVHGSIDSKKQLETELGQHYSGQATLTYKGREALELALQKTGLPKGSAVGVNGFTCYAVYQAVKNAGHSPIFIDITPNQLDFNQEQLQKAHSNENLAAIIIQNTLGYPVDITPISRYCQEEKIMIIEDLAHSQGASYKDGHEVGTLGELTMLSFSQDKPLDVVAGGVLINRRASAVTEENTPQPLISIWQRFINRLYPFWTGLIKVTYSFGLGKILHFTLKKFHLLATPMSDKLHGLHAMDNSTAKLALKRWQERTDELQHRREIADVYQKALSKKLQPFTIAGKPSYLRFALWVENRTELVNYLKSHHIYVGDTWYDAPIGPKKYLERTNYQTGTCPNSEALSSHIVNLPTHINVSLEQAQFITEKVSEWLK